MVEDGYSQNNVNDSNTVTSSNNFMQKKQAYSEFKSQRALSLRLLLHATVTLHLSTISLRSEGGKSSRKMQTGQRGDRVPVKFCVSSPSTSRTTLHTPRLYVIKLLARKRHIYGGFSVGLRIFTAMLLSATFRAFKISL